MSSFNRKTVKTPALLSRLQRGFSPSRWFRGAEGLRLLHEGGARPEWIIGRRLCVYTVLDGGSVPPRRRAAFADMAVNRWSPFADTQRHVEWAGDRAMVWAWSRDRVMQNGDDGSFVAPRRMFPESLFRGRPLAEGEELLAMEEGFEGRAWRDSQLVASHWWEDIPDIVEWNEFRRGAGVRSEAHVPEPLHLPLEAAAWGTARANGMGELVQQQRVLLAALAVAATSTLLAAPLVGAIALKVSIWQVQADIAEREMAIAEILRSKESAQVGAAAIEQQLRMRPAAGQTALLAAVGRLIPGRWQLLAWEMPDAEHLQLTLRMAGADPRRIVEAWEKSGQFTEVTAEVVRQPDEVQVKAGILRARTAE